MQVRPDQAWEAFEILQDAEWFEGERIKGLRDRPLTPGGRARLTLFEQVEGAGRPHPRMRIDFPPAEDPAPPADLIGAVQEAPTDATAFTSWLDGAFAAAQERIADLPDPDAAAGSPQYRRNSVRAQRIHGFFQEAGDRLDGWLGSGTMPSTAEEGARYALRRAEAAAYARKIRFDDEDTGTYHSYGHDSPFVHHLERILASLPEEGSEAHALLDEEQQGAVARQRGQVRNHVDFLMRRKYAYDGIVETDIERSLGGVLIDRDSRHVVSETPESRDSLTPAYEVLRIDAGSGHAAAGAWVYRDADSLRREDDGSILEGEEPLMERTPVDAARLSFRRAPEDERLRADIRLDWDGNGYLRDEPLEWVGWAGHCDIKAVMESLGIALLDGPSVDEYRSDTGRTETYDRDLLVEMVAATMELGSVYRRADGRGRIQRGVHRFGGARNDSRPDRLQFQGPGQGKSFRWPLGGRQDAFRVTGIERDGEALDVGRVFFRQLPDMEALDFAPNPAFLKTVEQDYNVIDVSGTVIRAKIKEEVFHSRTGYATQSTTDTVVDLRAEPETPRSYLGTAMKDAARREVYRVYLDRDAGGIEAVLQRYERGEESGEFAPVEVPDGTVRLPMVAPLNVTLSHEMKRDDPAMFQSLLDVALRQAQNICADTDMRAEVWNGVVTRIAAERLAENRETRVEHWRVDIKARFGAATLDYLVRCATDGRPEAYCPVPGEQTVGASPDFLWQDIPDVASKGVEPLGGAGEDGGVWVINDTMLERDIVTLSREPEMPGGIYVYDDHVKNVFELLHCGLGGFPYTVVHGNKRYGFRDEGSWRAAIEGIEELRAALSFDAGS